MALNPRPHDYQAGFWPLCHKHCPATNIALVREFSRKVQNLNLRGHHSSLRPFISKQKIVFEVDFRWIIFYQKPTLNKGAPKAQKLSQLMNISNILIVELYSTTYFKRLMSTVRQPIIFNNFKCCHNISVKQHFISINMVVVPAKIKGQLVSIKFRIYFFMMRSHFKLMITLHNWSSQPKSSFSKALAISKIFMAKKSLLKILKKWPRPDYFNHCGRDPFWCEM